MKTCNKCKLEKPETDFYLRSETDFYIRSEAGKREASCKECWRANQKIYSAEHREEIAAKEKIYRAKNLEKIAAQKKTYRAKNREKIAAKAKIKRAENLEKETSRARVYRYGVTPGAFKRMLANQGGVCAICGGLGGKKGFCVDHDHESKEVRGLLCSTCNTGIGFLKDSSDITRRASDYLKQYGK